MRALILLLLILATAPAAFADSTPHWFEVRSEHFVVLTDSNEKQARHIASQFERMRTVFHKLLPNSTADIGVAPIVVLALKDKKGFQALEPAAYLAKGQLELAGYFLSAQDTNYILLRLDNQGEDHPFATIYHEYTHFMVRKLIWVPLWMNEGMAEFYQNSDIEDKDVLFGEPSPNDILYLRQNTLLPLTTLLAVDHSSPYYHDEQKGSVFYCESWALMHFIIVSDRQKGTEHFTDYAKNLIHGEDPVTAAQHAFGDLKLLQSALQTYIQRGDYMQFKMPSAITVDESTFKVVPTSTTDVDAIRADVLADNGRTKDAEALLDTVMRDDPKNAPAHETMGSIKLREGDHEAARKWYGEAVQLDSQSYLAHYYFAMLSNQSSDHDAIESSFRQSIKLNPSFAPAYDGLAAFLGRRREKLEDAHMLTLQAVQLEPENFTYRLNAASILMEQQNFDGALSVLRAATKVTRNPDEAAILDSRIHQIELMQNAMQHPRESDTATTSTNTVVNGMTDISNSDPDADGPKYPEGPPTGPHHTVKGVLHGVKCTYPTVLTLTLDQAGKSLTLYSNNYYKTPFYAVNFTPAADIDPCKGIDGMKAEIEYTTVTDKVVAGQVVSIKLSK